MSGDAPKTAQMQQTPAKTAPLQMQVPTLLPIYVRLLPPRDLMPPSRAQQAEDEREQALERKRQSIRNHQDFPVVRRRFYYLGESDIMRAFVINKGHLRKITDYLTAHFNKDEILLNRDIEARKKQAASEEEALRQKQALLAAQRQRDLEELEIRLPVSSKPPLDDEDASPVKIRGKARVKPGPRAGLGRLLLLHSFEEPQFVNSSPEKVSSTKVVLEKPKVSILEKYKNKQQPRIDQAFGKQDDAPKRRKLVRGSALGASDDSLSSGASTPGLTAAFSNLEASPKLIKTADGRIVAENLVPEDELDLLEEKIRQNRRKKQYLAPAAREIEMDSDGDLLDDAASDSMSEEDDMDTYSHGLTSMDGQVLEFLNTGLTLDLMEICNIAPKVAQLLVSKRPFESVYAVAEDDFEILEDTPEAEAPAPRRRGTRKLLGLKIVETTEFSLKGYRAVDSLVRKCSHYGDIIASQMAQWGVSVTGEGELEMVELPDMESGENGAENDENDDVSTPKKTLTYLSKPPALLAPDVTLKNYQQVGVNWLNLLYQNRLSCILADEMGLGKTCQVIAFMAHLKDREERRGPHLVVVPASTLENWLREFHKFCPDLVVQAYYGLQREREDLRYDLQDQEFDVMVTTYNLATGAAPDFKFLTRQNFDVVVYDEGHMLKNSLSDRYSKLMRLQAHFRLLLTGTPLQNNLRELVSLLAFMLPRVFHEKREDLQGLFNKKVSTKMSKEDENYNPLLSVQAINKAKTMMTPFVLRRKKVQVLKHLPAKLHTVRRCGLTPSQHAIYDQYFQQGRQTRLERERRKLLTGKEAEEARKSPIPTTSNVMMHLRKAALHPLLFRKIYDDEKLAAMTEKIMKEPDYAEAKKEYIFEDMTVMSDYELNLLCEQFPKSLSSYVLPDSAWNDSGKVTALLEVLHGIVERKEKVLVFSLFTQVLDVLERVLTLSKITFLRLDGQTSVDTRQDLIDKFYEDSTIPVFLLSTKAGGFGINLVAANNVVMFDQSFNPHDDKQAEDRAHRVGQTKEVLVTKLITENTIEENMLQLAENKLQLDQSISAGEGDTKFEEKAVSMFEKILFG